ncbi:MAG: DVUA0089 family protein, partial [Fimbriimonadales bacterium]|nr:DVUA0089 family protein [Fimbriimonadales bacterium]
VYLGPRDPSRYIPYSDFFPASGGSTSVNVANTPSYDGFGASCNVRITVAAAGGKSQWVGVGWSVRLTASAPSYLSEIAVAVTNINGEGYIIRPAVGDAVPGSGAYSSGGIRELCGYYRLPPLDLPDGNLYLEFFETYNDFADCAQDGNWDSGSLTFTFGNPAPFEGHTEIGDAGDLPDSAQATPAGVLRAIRGRISANDVDVYAIRITNPAAFSARTAGQCNTGLDTQLWLFDAAGRGVVFNDDSPGVRQSLIDNSAGCITAAGVYYLAISVYDRDAAGCNGSEIWADTPYGSIRCPDGAESGSRVGGWTGSTAATGSYIIELTGAEGATPGDPADCPPFQGWDEFTDGGGDAGDLPETSQSVRNATIPLIRGQLDTNDVDMFAIQIDNPAAFSATTVGGATFDTQLWLFDSNGKGVVFNDDFGGLQSRIDNSTNCITQPGVYYLAISRYNRDAIGCEGDFIWNDSPFGTIRCPDGPEPASRVNGWSGGTAAAGEYRIILTGVRGATRGDPANCPPPGADQWDETANGGGDAGDLPNNAQPVYSADRRPCQDPVTRITGNRASTDDADMFVICITDPANFSATTVGGAGFDTQLWLFRCDGTGIVHNDDFGSLQSRIDNSTGCLNGLQAGTYLLALTGYNQDPVDAQGRLLWNDSPFSAIRCPDGPGASNPMAGWTGTGGSGTYRITLTGAYFVRQSGCGPSCEGDANRDGRVDDADLLIVLFQFGQSGFGLQGDVDNNGTVDDADLLIVLFNFGCGS